MKHRHLLVLCLVLAIGGLACSAKQEKLTRSGSGYHVSVAAAPDIIWLTPPSSYRPDNYLGFGELVVRVQDAQGQPINGVPVAFEVDPAWAQTAVLKPLQAITEGGLARATIEPNALGVVQVIVRVDDVTMKTAFVAQDQWHNSTPMGVGGLPYPLPR
ncbi:MAG: Ig-like domain-containing protein [Candidatus Tectomicrobia bacterium]|nr:Ig-like domain-containing protein [Candidatus Tectomicrobia bacterium]